MRPNGVIDGAVEKKAQRLSIASGVLSGLALMTWVPVSHVERSIKSSVAASSNLHFQRCSHIFSDKPLNLMIFNT